MSSVSTARNASVFPTDEQRVLLEAALLPKNNALVSWQSWKASNTVDEKQRDSYRLLPLVYLNLRSVLREDHARQRLKAVYEENQTRNRRLISALSALLQHLHRAGIETLVLKGIHLALSYYRDPGARPMYDFDVLVHPGKVVQACEVLREHDWKLFAIESDQLQNHLEFHHATPLIGPEGYECDLHWSVFKECCSAQANRGFWEAADSLQVEGARTFCLSKSDLLLHIVTHGLRWNRSVRTRWVCDAYTILQSRGELDWDRLVMRAEELRFGLCLQIGLRYLMEHFDVVVPPEVLRSLKRSESRIFQKMENRYLFRDDEQRSAMVTGDLTYFVLEYVRLVHFQKPWKAVKTMPVFLRYFFKVRNNRELLRALIGKCYRRAAAIGPILQIRRRILERRRSS